MTELVPQLRQQGLARFDFLGGALPGRVAPTDVDLLLERRGHLLFIECKRPGQQIPTGQRRTLDALVALSTPKRTVYVVVVVGHPPATIVGAGFLGRNVKPCSCDEIRTFVRHWWDWAGTA